MRLKTTHILAVPQFHTGAGLIRVKNADGNVASQCYPGKIGPVVRQLIQYSQQTIVPL